METVKENNENLKEELNLDEAFVSDVRETVIVCKKAACSGHSSHISLGEINSMTPLKEVA